MSETAADEMRSAYKVDFKDDATMMQEIQDWYNHSIIASIYQNPHINSTRNRVHFIGFINLNISQRYKYI